MAEGEKVQAPQGRIGSSLGIPILFSGSEEPVESQEGLAILHSGLWCQGATLGWDAWSGPWTSLHRAQTATLKAGPSHPSSDPVLTQGDFLPRVCREQEHEEGQGRDEHTGNEKVEAIVEGPAADGDSEGHIRVRLFAALIELLTPLARDPFSSRGRKEPPLNKRMKFILRGYNTHTEPWNLLSAKHWLIVV